MSRKSSNINVVLACCAGIFASTPSLAATVNIDGDNFDVSYDDSQVGITLYGAPQYGFGTNNILFSQNGFNVTSTDGNGALESLASTVSITLTRNSPSFNFESIFLLEQGTYTMNGDGTSVNLTGSMNVTSNIFGPSAPIAAIAPNDPMETRTNSAVVWQGGAFADLSAPVWESQNSITLLITNILQANTTQLGTFAYIDKQFAGGAVQIGVNGAPAVAAVPVPAAAWLMISGLLGLAGVARRK